MPIKDVKEDDLVQCTDAKGLLVYQPVVIKESHTFDGEIFEFLLDNDTTLLVTPNHGMMVDRKTVIADLVNVGSQFETVDTDALVSSRIIQKRLLTAAEHEIDTVYNVITPELTVIVDGVLVTCRGESGINEYPELLWTIGCTLSKFPVFGAPLARKMHSFFDKDSQ